MKIGDVEVTLEKVVQEKITYGAYSTSLIVVSEELIGYTGFVINEASKELLNGQRVYIGRVIPLLSGKFEYHLVVYDALPPLD